MHKAQTHTNMIRAEAQRLGFDQVGMAKAEFMEEEARHLEQWLQQGMHGQMHYMANHFDKRVDPTQLVPGAKSVISLVYNYYNPAKQEDPAARLLPRRHKLRGRRRNGIRKSGRPVCTALSHARATGRQDSQ